MIITYKMYYLIVAFLLLLVLLYHFRKQRRVKDINSRIFFVFIYFGLFDVIFDIISTILISGDYPNLVFSSKIILTCFYFMQVTLPGALMCYSLSLRSASKQSIMKKVYVSVFITVIMIIFVIGNIFGGYLFYFDAEGYYFRGFLYYVTYVYAIFVGLAILIGSIVHIKELTKEKLNVIEEFLIIEVVTVLIQAYTGELTTGLGTAIGILVLYLTINNPRNYIDNLTGLFDKQYFGIWMRQQIEKKKTIHIFVIELSSLRQINKIYGATVGNQLLLQVADHLQEISRTENIFRTGGNQFILVSDSLREYEFQKTHLKNYFNWTFHVNREQISFPTILCGIMDVSRIQKKDILEAYIDYMIASAPKTNETILIQGNAKTMEGFRYEQEIEKYLTEAIEKDLFEVYYQPVYSLETSSFITIEALSRLSHPSLGRISPDVFIGIAERSGQLAQIGVLQLKKICRFLKEHPEILRKIENVKFNLSYVELLKPGHCRVLIDIIKNSGISTEFFQFEITETVATEYSEELYRIVKEFKDEGIALCLDDFGSGYANLNMVLKLPFSVIKLDRSLLFDIIENQQIASFYKNIVHVFQNMGYVVISEGVETEEELTLLKTWGVNMIQGYYFSKPVDENKIVEILQK